MPGTFPSRTFVMNPVRLPLALAIAALPLASHAQDARLPDVVVSATKADDPSATRRDAASLAPLVPATSDAASLLRDIPGVSLYGAGGVSSLPVIHGLADDRLRTKVDGVETIAACPNHMNSPLSYIDAANVGTVKVYSGIAPVSVGGDSIGGAIVVDAPAPEFAESGKTLFNGRAGTFYRSNGDGHGANLAATYATDALSLAYTGSTAEAADYKAGGDYKKFTMKGAAPAVGSDVVGSTAYKAENQTLGIALKGGSQLVEAKVGYQHIPYELYPNQRMDMLDNKANRFTLRYLGQFDWGSLEGKAYYEDVKHYMDFGKDKLYSYGPLKGTNGITYQVNGMPMDTHARTAGASVKADVSLNPRDLLRVGADLQNYHLDDWWPPAPDCGVGNCSGGMAPYTFWNINGGKRDRLGVFGEWEAKWNSQWESLAGIRFEQVSSDTGTIQGYNPAMYTTSSAGTTAAFNAMDRKRTDNNTDFTLSARDFPNVNSAYAFGYAQKTRSPNLYERYDWSKSAMALEMNNFVGDGNGYLGNPDLKPEIAHTLSFTGDWHSADGEYQLMATPYYTRVTNFIDAVRYPATISMYVNGVMTKVANATLANGYVLLQYANEPARLYGIDISGHMPLAKTGYGDWGLKGLLNYTNGKNLDTNDGLYNIMPLNTTLTLTHKFGGWDNALEVVGVKAKDDVSEVRNEIKTPGYGLVNLRASYSWTKVRIDFGIENLFDRLYYLPLGGAYTGQGATMSLDREVGTVTNTAGTTGTATTWGTAVPGAGRSLYAGVTVKF